MTGTSGRRPVWAILLGFALVLPHGLESQEPQQILRGSTTLVPVDVRVVDDRGQPVTDLTAEDFTIREDGRPQAVAHFSKADYEGQDSLAPDERVRRLDQPPAVSSSSRTFLILLGRGRLNGPGRGLEAAIDLVRTRLRPTDYVAVVAYDRISEVTRERSSILRLLEVYRTRHEVIEGQLDLYYDGLAGRFARPRVDGGTHAGIQRGIDRLFEEPGLPPMRHLATVARSDQLNLDTAVLDSPPDVMTSPGALTSDAAARDDLHRLYAGINYLRQFHGEKHLVLLSEEGLLYLERSEVADGFAAIAADARVTVSAIHTAGLQTSWDSGTVQAFNGPSWAHRFAVMDSRSMADKTGGIASAYRYAAEGFDRLERATRSGYVLGYYPPARRSDGRFRRIEVTVNRPGVTVLHRHGYYDRDAPVPGDRRRVIAQARIATAAVSRMRLRDLEVSLRASYVSRGDAGWRVRAEVVIDPARVRFVEINGVQHAQLDVAVFAGNANDDLVGEAWERVDLKLDAATFRRLERESISYEMTFGLKAAGGRLKAVVYDYLGDRVGTATREIR